MSLIRKPFRYSFFHATFIIIALNMAVFFLTSIFPGLKLYMGISFAGLVLCHFYWQPVTYLFVHAGASHILFNMLALLFFGIQIERAVGSKEFLLFYFLCGILDGIISVVLYSFLGMQMLIIGASGAVYALLFAYAVIFPRNIIYIWGIIPVAAPLLVFIYALIEIISQIFGGLGIAHLTHLAGFAAAWIYFIARMGIHPLKIWKDAWR